MTMIVKSEWREIEKRFKLDLNASLVERVYPYYNEEEVYDRMKEIITGEYSAHDFILDAQDEGIELDFQWFDDRTDQEDSYCVTSYEVVK